MALPVILLVVIILAMVGGAMATLGSAGLREARADASSEQAHFAAEAGIAQAASLLQGGSGPTSFTGKLPVSEATYSVVFMQNLAETPESVDGVTIPPATMMARSTGTSREGKVRRSWALYRLSEGNIKVGLLSKRVNATDSEFKVEDSAAGIPLESGDVMASNETMGQVYSLVNSMVNGTLFVGKGGNPDGTAVEAPTPSEIKNRAALAKVIEWPEVTVPNLPAASADGSGPDPDATPTPVPQLFKAPGNSQYIVQPPSNPSAPMTIEKNCFTMKIWPDGSYTAIETGSGGKSGSGNLLTGDSTGSFTVQTSPFKLVGKWHTAMIDLDNKTWGYDKSTGPSASGPSNYQESDQFPEWVWDFFTPAPSVENATELPPGRYDTVVANSVETTLQSNGTYVIGTLNVNTAGSLKVPADGGNVKIYVTKQLTLDGLNAILNQTKKAPNLKVFFAGEQDVTVTGGADAYCTLIAPKALVKLSGLDPANPDPLVKAEFHGALVGRELQVTNARFFYDVATEGIGADSEGTSIKLLARYRD